MSKKRASRITCNKLKQLSVVFDAVKPPKATSCQSRAAQATDNYYATVERSWSEYSSLSEAEIFSYAFKLGMRIAIETLTK